MTEQQIWEAMNAVREAFDEISTLEFLSERLQVSIDAQAVPDTINAAHALSAFIPTYVQNFEEKFDVAWKGVVKPVDLLDL